jgi:nucleotide-binding universal stress UspA family protein
MRYPLKVLAPTDLAQDSEAGVQHAIDFARSVDGELTLLYVIDQMRWRKRRPIEWPPHAMAGGAACRMRRVVLSGPVTPTVAGYADDIDADIITLTSRHFGGWSRFWATSATAGIVNSTNRPVCVTKARPAGRGPRFQCKRILCIVGLDGTDGPVLARAEQLSLRTGAELFLLHVVPEPSEALFLYGTANRPLSERLAVQQMRELAAGISCPHMTSVVTGSEHASISRTARERGVDLVLVSRPLQPGAEPPGIDLRALTARLGCPVLSVTTPVPQPAIIRERVPVRSSARV